MTDRDAHLAGICAAPDDDAPRLIYADWLDEHGEPERAAFVRIQVELARTRHNRNHRHQSFGGAPCEACRFKGQEEKLVVGSTRESNRCPAWAGLEEWPGEEWFGAYQGQYMRAKAAQVFRVDPGPADRPVLGTFFFSRGFVESVTCTAADWLAHGDELLAAHPITEVRLASEPDLQATAQRWRGGNYWRLPGRPTEDRRQDGENWRPLCLRLLAAEWPAVKAWHLPPEPNDPYLWGAVRQSRADAAIAEAMVRAGEALRRMEQLAAQRPRRPRWPGVEEEVARATANARRPRTTRRPPWPDEPPR